MTRTHAPRHATLALLPLARLSASAALLHVPAQDPAIQAVVDAAQHGDNETDILDVLDCFDAFGTGC